MITVYGENEDATKETKHEFYGELQKATSEGEGNTIITLSSIRRKILARIMDRHIRENIQTT